MELPSLSTSVEGFWASDPLTNGRILYEPSICYFDYCHYVCVCCVGLPQKNGRGTVLTSGLLVKALLKQSSQDAHIILCQRGSELSEWKKQAGISFFREKCFVGLVPW